ncbi:hypothetical protein [Bacillus piscicola]|nr:hypothetical protein [Bacillus piscicola]
MQRENRVTCSCYEGIDRMINEGGQVMWQTELQVVQEKKYKNLKRKAG